MPIEASAAAVRECSRADDDPVRAALFDELFLQLMLCEPLAQEKRNKDVLLVEGRHIPALTATERRDTDETAHADLCHGVEDVPRPLRSHRVFRESRRPESRHHVLLTLQGLFHQSEIHDVALNRLEIRVFDLELGGITRKRPDCVPSGESLLDQLATNATC